MTLETIKHFTVPAPVVTETEEALREAGKDGFELFALWTGVSNGAVFGVRNVHVPAQQTYKGKAGLCVTIGGEALFELNRWLFENNQQLGVQVHTHPKDAYHSETDDTYPIVTQWGGLSVVVPRFCKEGVSGPGIAVFRLSQQGWDELPRKAAQALLRFT